MTRIPRSQRPAKCWGPDEAQHKCGCRKHRPRCRWRRAQVGETCQCSMYHYPHRKGSGACGAGVPDALHRARKPVDLVAEHLVNVVAFYPQVIVSQKRAANVRKPKAPVPPEVFARRSAAAHKAWATRRAMAQPLALSFP